MMDDVDPTSASVAIEMQGLLAPTPKWSICAEPASSFEGYSERLEQKLREGWEPFAVSMDTLVWLRRSVDPPPHR